MSLGLSVSWLRESLRNCLARSTNSGISSSNPKWSRSRSKWSLNSMRKSRSCRSNLPRTSGLLTRVSAIHSRWTRRLRLHSSGCALRSEDVEALGGVRVVLAGGRVEQRRLRLLQLLHEIGRAHV